MPQGPAPLSSSFSFQMPLKCLFKRTCIKLYYISLLSHSLLFHSGPLPLGDTLIQLPKRDNFSTSFETNNKIRPGLNKAPLVYSDPQRVKHRIFIWKPLFSPAELCAWANMFMRPHKMTDPESSFKKHLISCTHSQKPEWCHCWVNGQ